MYCRVRLTFGPQIPDVSNKWANHVPFCGSALVTEAVACDCIQHSLWLLLHCRRKSSASFFEKCLGYRGGTLTVLRLVRLIFWTTKSSTSRVRCPPNINALIAVIFFVIRSSLSLVDTASVTVAIWRMLGELNIHCFWLFDCKTI